MRYLSIKLRSDYGPFQGLEMETIETVRAAIAKDLW